MPRTQERLGLLFAALCAANGAFVPAFAKLTTERADPFFVAAATTLFAGVFAALVLGLRGDLEFLVGRGTGPRLFIVGTLGTACAFLLFFYGAQRTTAIEAVLCLQIEPAYSLVLSWMFLGHRPTPRRVAAIGVLLAGITLAVGGRGVSPSAGVWALLITPLCWQASHLVVLRRLTGVSPHVLTGARYVDGGLVLAIAWLARGGVAALPEPAQLRLLLPLLALQGIILSYVGTLLLVPSDHAARPGAVDGHRRAVHPAAVPGCELLAARRSPDGVSVGRSVAHCRGSLRVRDGATDDDCARRHGCRGGQATAPRVVTPAER